MRAKLARLIVPRLAEWYFWRSVRRTRRGLQRRYLLAQKRLGASYRRVPGKVVVPAVIVTLAIAAGVIAQRQGSASQ